MGDMITAELNNAMFLPRNWSERRMGSQCLLDEKKKKKEKKIKKEKNPHDKKSQTQHSTL